jgi:hypothetical protein
VVAPAALAATALLGFWFFQDRAWNDAGEEAPKTFIFLSGLVFLSIVERVAWTIIDYAYTAFGTLVLLRVLQLWGTVDGMRLALQSLAATPARKITLFGFAFAATLGAIMPTGASHLLGSET